MARRDEAKAHNRSRIRAAAAELIRAEGIGSLTMRRLAERAGVSLRTPYNLFGSKTDVLIALLQDAGFQPFPENSGQDGRSLIEHLQFALTRIETFFGSDEDYYREIYEGIMTSDHREARRSGLDRVIDVVQRLIGHAVAQGELHQDTDVALLGRHLAVELLAVLGMWGSGLLSNHESISQVRRAWFAVLLRHCNAAFCPSLETAYNEACHTGRVNR